MLNLFGGEICWMRKIEFVVALSIIKVEYMETIHARKWYGYRDCVQVSGWYNKLYGYSCWHYDTGVVLDDKSLR